MPSASQNTGAMTFPADGTDLAFFGAEHIYQLYMILRMLYYFYVFLDFGTPSYSIPQKN
jgi:hypothetical protein